MAAASPTFPTSRETTNYARLCALLVDVGSQVLRETFDRIRPRGRLDTVLGTPPTSDTLKSLLKKKVVKPSQWSSLYPAIKSSVSSEKFDITLLMVLLRNICGLTPPAAGWDKLPAPTDVSCEDDLARIKCYRNKVYGHAVQASVDDANFSNYWLEIRDALVRLGGADYEAAIDVLKYDCMDPVLEEQYIEMLKQWKVDEDSLKDKLNIVEAKVDNVQASVNNVEAKVDDFQAVVDRMETHLVPTPGK